MSLDSSIKMQVLNITISWIHHVHNSNKHEENETL